MDRIGTTGPTLQQTLLPCLGENGSGGTGQVVGRRGGRHTSTVTVWMSAAPYGRVRMRPRMKLLVTAIVRVRGVLWPLGRSEYNGLAYTTFVPAARPSTRRKTVCLTLTGRRTLSERCPLSPRTNGRPGPSRGPHGMLGAVMGAVAVAVTVTTIVVIIVVVVIVVVFVTLLRMPDL